MDARLLVSLSGIGPRTLHRCADLAAELDRRNVPLSLLFAPRTEGTAATAAWVRERTRRGDGLLLHGYDHRIPPGHRRVGLGRKAEFAALPAHEARLRMIAAKADLDKLGLSVDGFAPPRWLASPGTLAAAREHFALVADLVAVHDLRTHTVHRSRVQTFAAHNHRTETVRAFALVLGSARAARRGGLVRLGIDAADLARPGLRHAFLDAVDVALENRAFGTTYGSLTSSPRVGTRTSVPSGARLVNRP